MQRWMLNRAKRFADVMISLATHLSWRGGKLRECYLCEIWPELRDQPVTVSVGVSHRYELPYGERVILAGIVSALKPRLVFEIGTFTGATTVLLARAAGTGAVVHTLDLPETEIVDQECRSRIGQEFSGKPADGAKIVLHRVNSRQFNFSAFCGQCDLVVIDGSHAYRDVLGDSQVALRLVAPNGIIVWDDYHPAVPGVVRALERMANELDLVRVSQSRLVVYSPARALAQNQGCKVASGP